MKRSHGLGILALIGGAGLLAYFASRQSSIPNSPGAGPNPPVTTVSPTVTGGIGIIQSYGVPGGTVSKARFGPGGNLPTPIKGPTVTYPGGGLTYRK